MVIRDHQSQIAVAAINSMSRRRHGSTEMHPRATCRRTFPTVLKATRPLAELVVIHGDRCWLAAGVHAEVHRGIKNYVRKHRKHDNWA